MVFNNPHIAKRLRTIIYSIIFATYGFYIYESVDGNVLVANRYEELKNKYTKENSVDVNTETDELVKETFDGVTIENEQVDLNAIVKEVVTEEANEEVLNDEPANIIEEQTPEVEEVSEIEVVLPNEEVSLSEEDEIFNEVEEVEETAKTEVVETKEEIADTSKQESVISSIDASEYLNNIKDFFVNTYRDYMEAINFFKNRYYDSKNEEVLTTQEEVEVTSIPEVEVYDDEIIYNTKEDEVTETEEVEEVMEIPLSDELLKSGYEFKDIDWEGLASENEDTCAWIESGSAIDYPIVQGEDNDYYLHHDFTGKKSSSGTLFVDSRTNPINDGEFSKFTVIYGHNMKNGSLFGTIDNYVMQKYYDDNKFGVLYTPSGRVFKVEYFAARIVDANNPIKIDASKDEETIFNEYIENLKADSTFESDVEVNYDDNILVLSSCISTGTNQRICLFGKLVEQKTKYYDKSLSKTFEGGRK